MALLPYDTETTQEFFAQFLKTELGSRMERDGLLTARNTRLLVKSAQEDAGHDDITLTEFSRTANEMYWEVLLDGQEEVVEVKSEPQLSSSQKAWQEYRIWSEQHTSDQCRARAKTDEGYRIFREKNIERELGNTPHTTFTNLNVKKPADPEGVTAQVRQFAEDYRHMSVAQVKSLLSPASAGEVVAAHYQRLFDEACNAGLI